MTACALPRFMFTWVPSGNVRLTPESMSQDSDRGAGLSVAIGRNRLPESSDKGGIGSPMPSCRQSRRRFLASFTDSPLFSIHRFILPCLTLHLFRKEVRVAVGLWDSSFKNAFHTLSYRFAAIILVILYSRGKGKELKDAEQGCIADTLTSIAVQNRLKRLKKRSIAVHQLRRCVTDHLNSTKNGACPFTRKNRSRCHQDACDRKTEHVRSLFPLNVNPHQKNGACPFTSLLFLRYCMWKNQHTTRDHGRKDKGHEPD